jgi:ribonucleoside-diphosphate reductase alpha chain
MGFAGMLYSLRIPYNSREGRNLASKLMGFIQKSAEEKSEDLANTKGIFGNFDDSVFSIKQNKELKKNVLRRNAALTCVAPTGSISMIFDSSGGIEPFFALAYHYKNVLGGNVKLTYFNKYLKAELIKKGLYTPSIIKEICETGSIQHIEEIPDEIKKVFVTAMDISSEDHIGMQAAFQQHCDNSISKTINFKFSATMEDVEKGYIDAWSKGCNGCTVYRNGSRSKQVLNVGKEKKKKNESEKVEKKKKRKVIKKKIEINNLKITKYVTDKSPKRSNSLSSSSSSSSSESISNSDEFLVDVFSNNKTERGACPDCKLNSLVFSEGCNSCAVCGYSACSRK